MTNIWDYINAINDTKVDLFAEEGEHKEYSPFMVNRALSYFADTLLLANEMNRCPNLTHEQHFKFLLNSVRKKRRFSKWAKKSSSDDLNAVMEYYKFSRQKALQVLKFLNKDQLVAIRTRINKGGKDEAK